MILSSNRAIDILLHLLKGTENLKTNKQKHTKATYTWICVTVLFITARMWEQMGCPSVDEWLSCSLSRHWNTLSALQGNDLLGNENLKSKWTNNTR